MDEDEKREVANAEFDHIYQGLVHLFRFKIIDIKTKQELENIIDEKIFTQFRQVRK